MASGSDPPSRWYTIFLLPSSQVPTTWPLTGAATPIVVTVKRTTPAAAIFDSIWARRALQLSAPLAALAMVHAAGTSHSFMI